MKKKLMYGFIIATAIGSAFAFNSKPNAKFDITAWKSDCSASATVACTDVQNNNGACTHNFGSGAVTVFGKTGSSCNISLYKLD